MSDWKFLVFSGLAVTGLAYCVWKTQAAWRQSGFGWRAGGGGGMSVEQLRNDLFYSSNDVIRDDAAERLGDTYWREDEAQKVLFDAISSAALNDSLKLTCAESLAEIWIRRGQVNDDLYERLEGSKLRETIDAFLKSPKPSNW